MQQGHLVAQHVHPVCKKILDRHPHIKSYLKRIEAAPVAGIHLVIGALLSRSKMFHKSALVLLFRGREGKHLQALVTSQRENDKYSDLSSVPSRLAMSSLQIGHSSFYTQNNQHNPYFTMSSSSKRSRGDLEATMDEWHRREPEIRKLYLDEKMTLSDVKKVMEERGFHEKP